MARTVVPKKQVEDLLEWTNAMEGLEADPGPLT